MSDPEESTQISSPAIWRAILTGGGSKSWVLFERGTIVILTDPSSTTTPDLATQAIEILEEWGPVHAGTPSGDFNVIDLNGNDDDDAPGGYVVTGHHPDVLNYVPSDAVQEGAPDMIVGLIGRGNRDEDARGLTVVHVEDNRGKP
ncbi:hypothetical protein BJY01DRAFT_255671 [Aspergillus pseudoustus]|uniref:Profilin n=1 Tax=Aspergillus pseudoustus TaxID=1810923 RepID=A0ABR4IJS5_9EURO